MKISIYGFIKYSILASVPILGIYSILPGVTLAFLLLLVLLPFDFILSYKSFRLNKSILFFMLFLIFINLFSYNFNYEFAEYTLTINNTIYLLLFLLIAVYYTSININYLLFQKVSNWFAIFATFIIFIQSYFLFIRGEILVFFLPLPIGFDDFTQVSINWGRPNSIFMEPAHYAIFILPLLYLALKKLNYKLAIFYILGIILSTSTFGIIGSIIVILWYSIRSSKHLFVIVPIVATLLFISFFFSEFSSLIIDQNLNKLSNSISLSDNVRLFGVWNVVEGLNFKQLLIGLGHNQLANYMMFQGYSNAHNYSNSFLFIIFSFGILGFIGLMWYLIVLLHENKEKVYFIILTLVMLSDQILFNQNLLYVLFTIYYFKESNFNNIKYFYNKNT